METFLELFGFTTVVNSMWNTASYIAFTIIIVGVFSERYRNILITLGAVALAVYAGIFLKNPLFATLQTLIPSPINPFIYEGVNWRWYYFLL